MFVDHNCTVLYDAFSYTAYCMKAVVCVPLSVDGNQLERFRGNLDICSALGFRSLDFEVQIQSMSLSRKAVRS